MLLRDFTTRTITQAVSWALAAVAWMLAGTAQAALVPDVDFRLDISAYEEVLMNPPGSASAYACGEGIVELMAYTEPFVLLENLSDMPIDQLKITLSDEDFHFSNNNPTLASYTGSGYFSDVKDFTTTVTALDGSTTSVAIDREMLTIDFVNGGLQPNQKAIIRLGLDADTMLASPYYPFVDYREVLLGSDTRDGAIFSVSAMMGQPGAMTTSVTQKIAEEDMIPIGFARQPGQMAPTQIFTISGVDEPVAVPEPSSLAAMALAAGGLMLALRRRR